MVKSLLNKLGKEARRVIFLVTALGALGFASCKLPDPTPIPTPTPIPASPIDLSTIISDVSNYNEGATNTETLPVSDINGNPVSYTSAVSVDGKTNPSISGNKLTITGNQNQTGNFNVKIGYNDNGNQETATLDGYLYNLLDFRQCKVENDETYSAQIGKAKIVLPDNSTSGTILLNNGILDFRYSIRADPKAPLSNLILKVIGTDASSNQNSFVRTIRLSNIIGDVTNLSDARMNPAIRVVPYSGFDISSEIIQMGRMNFSAGVTGNSRVGLKKWNRGELPDDANHPTFKGIEVSATDFPGGTGSGTDYYNIAELIHSSSYPNASSINVVYGDNHNGENGWGRIVLGTGGNTPLTITNDQNGSDGYIERFTTYLTKAQIVDYIVRHEVLGHGLSFPGHADSPTVTAFFNSLMKYLSYDTRYSPPQAPTDFTPFDLEGIKRVKEPTYLGMEQESDILGDTF